MTLDAACKCADDYAFYKLRISENGVTDEYSIRQYAATRKATIQPPAVRAYSAATTVVFRRSRSIRTWTSCLENTNMTVVYSYGTAREVSNDPELSTIYSNWDAALARSSVAEQRDVRAWSSSTARATTATCIRERLGGYDKNALRRRARRTLKTTAQVMQLPSNQARRFHGGLQVSEYLLAKKDGTQQEIVKVTGIVDGTKITVDRGAGLQRRDLGCERRCFCVPGGLQPRAGHGRDGGARRGVALLEPGE